MPRSARLDDERYNTKSIKCILRKLQYVWIFGTSNKQTAVLVLVDEFSLAIATFSAASFSSQAPPTNSEYSSL